MDFFDKEMYEKGMQFQKKMIGQYMDAVGKFADFFQKKEDDAETESPMDSIKEMTEQMMKDTGEMVQNMWTAYQDAWKKWAASYSMFDLTGTVPLSDMSSLFGRFFDSMSIYSRLYDFWKDCFEDLKDGIADPAELSIKYMEKSEALIQELSEKILKPAMSEDSFALLESWIDLAKVINSTTVEFMSPWLDRKDEFLDCIKDAFSGDKEAYSKYLTLVTDAYQDSFGKLFNINGVGITKDNLELNLDILNSYVRMMLGYFGMAAGLQNVLRDANAELFERIQDLIKDPEKKVTFKTFYDLWIKINSEMVNKFYFSEEYTTFMGEFANYAYDFKTKSDELMERMLSVLPVPTNSEMKSAYKTIYGLRKDVRDLKKEIATLHAKLDHLGLNTEE